MRNGNSIRVSDQNNQLVQDQIRIQNVIAMTEDIDWPQGNSNEDKVDIRQKVVRFDMNNYDQAIVFACCSWKSQNFQHTYCFDGRFKKLLLYYVDIPNDEARLLQQYQGFTQSGLIKKPRLLQLEIDQQFTPRESRILLIDMHSYEKLTLPADAAIADILKDVDEERWSDIPPVEEIPELVSEPVKQTLHTVKMKLF